VRNLLRRPSRTLLTLVALVTVVLLVFVLVGFIRGMEKSLETSGDPNVVLVYAVGVEQMLESSSIPAQTPGLLSASVEGIQNRYGVRHVSPELFLGTRVAVGKSEEKSLGLVRGVTQTTPLVRPQVQITEGSWPGPGEVLVGRLAAAKLGVDPDLLSVGQTLAFEGRTWRISGRFAADGSAFEAELWCLLSEIQLAQKRQDLSLIALRLAPGASPSGVKMFCGERSDLELHAVVETEYYAQVQELYRPVRMLGWLVTLLVAGAGVFAGLNMMYGAVAGRVRELAMLQAIGFRRRAVLLSLVQEAVLLAAAGSLVAALAALTLVNGAAVRFTMGAFALRIDAVAVLIGCGTGLLLGVAGAIPPGIRAMRLPVAESLKAI
jgi:ABC-type antimicrobial peptide transport system permease subunit